MGDNTDTGDETLDNHINIDSDKISNYNDFPNESDTIIVNQNLENMELHAHELHKAPGHGWKHYFFEFFMLFFAITLSFFVENAREQYEEHKREKEYISSLVRDLAKDTTELNSCIEDNSGMR